MLADTGAQGKEPVELENEGLFDELVLDDWLHLEKTDRNLWWARVADARLMVESRKDGTAVLEVERDGFE